MKELLPFCVLIFGCHNGATIPDEPATERGQPSAKSDGQTWCHANLTSNGGTDMVFDYRVIERSTGGSFEPGQDTLATDVWLNVRNPRFTPNDSATAVVLTQEYPGPCANSCFAVSQVTNVYNVPLRYESGRFTAQLKDLPIFSVPEATDGSDTTAFFWELAVVVNDTWYKDPSTGNNLRVPVATFPSRCAQGTTF
jgi:hypothetical protein